MSVLHKKEQVLDITQGVIWKQLLRFFFPLLFGTVFQLLYNTVDAIIVGKYVGKVALSAVGGASGSLVNVFFAFFTAVSSGATVVISQLYGGKKEADVGRAVQTAMLLSLAGGLAIMLIGLLGSPLFLKAMRTPEDILSLSMVYIRIVFCGMIPNLLYNMGAGILRAIGDSRRPLYYQIVCNLLNIGLDLLFVVVFDLGVTGVAIATVIAQLAGAALVCGCLIRTKSAYHLTAARLLFRKELLKRILVIGLPVGVQSLMFTVTNVVIQSHINSYGTNTIAGWTAFSRIDGIFWMIMAAFGVSVTTFVGLNYGGGQNDRISRGVRECLAMSLAAAVFLSAAFFAFGRSLLGLFTGDPAVVNRGMEILQVIVPGYGAYICIEILGGALKGLGNSFMPMVITGIGISLTRIVWLFLAEPVWTDIRIVALSYPLSWLITSVFYMFYYRLYRKMKKY